MLKFFEIRSPFFIPVWRRAVVTIFLALWGLLEASNNNLFWAGFFLGVAGYCGYVFFVDWHVDEDDQT